MNREPTEQEQDEALAILQDIDEVALALDILGWKIVCVEDDRKWLLSGPTDHVPDWCEPDEEYYEILPDGNYRLRRYNVVEFPSVGGS